ncbi:DNA polymerase I [Brevundimonas phage vB_BsubS-Delta]|nr:DNA polymerase I [Brevundimonas phage vB_BsubS-Delta]
MITRDMVTGSGKGNPPRATIDFETRSRSNLPKVGPWRYATDESTQPLCMSYRLPHWPQGKVKTWIPNIYQEFGIAPTEEPTELFEWIAAGGLVEAHNAMMEKAVWRAIMMPEYLWPDIPRSQWRCSSAKASSYGLPRGLEKACIVMRLPVQKDKEGHKLMMKLCKPRKPSKNDPREWWGTREEFLRLFAYCETDVLAEEAFSHSLLDLIPLEQELWKIDQDINEHGLPIDKAFVEAAIAHLNNMKESANAEINRRTNGQVPKATNRGALLEWLNSNGLELDNTQAATFDAMIAMPDDIPEHVLAVIKLVRRAGRASVAKYKAIMDRLTAGDRVRDMLVYAGASRTSRWSGAGFQPQNLPRGSIKDMEATIERIMASDEITDLETEFQIEGEEAADLFQLFSEALRGAIVPDPGKELVSADYNAIEARGLFWVCNHERGLDIFRDKSRDIYLDMAEDIYSVPAGTFNKKANPNERQVGKVGILGCGYGLGKNKMVDYGNKAFASAKVDLVMDLDFADRVVTGYRTKHKPVVDFWYACERAAIEAMMNPGQTIWVNDKIAYKRANRFLFCRLPSGRLIPYPYPEVRSEPSPFREGEFKSVLTYEEVNSVTKKWERTKTYGGKLVENIVQALCRDLMGYAMWSVYKHTKYQILLTVHDELVAQCPIGQGDVKEFEDIMCILPKWANGFPITAEGWKGLRYRK